MKFEILQENLKEGLSLALRSITSRPQLPVLSNVLIDARSDGVYISGTDLELGVSTKAGAKVEKEGKVTVPARMFSEFVSSIPAGKVEARLDKEVLKIESGSYSAEFQTISADEFPKLPGRGDIKGGVKISRKALSDCLEQVVYASAKDSMRPVLTGVYFDFSKSSFDAAATDGFRLAVSSVKDISGELPKKALIVPSRVLQEVMRASQGESVEFGVLPDSNQIVFVLEDSVYVSQLLDGNFPNYKKIIPDSYTSEVVFDREEMLQAVSAALVFARDNSNVLQIEVEGTTLTITAESPQQGKNTTEVAIEYDGDPNDIAFNGKFLLEFLQTSEDERIWMGLNERLSPGAFRGSEDKNFLYVVMPINL